MHLHPALFWSIRSKLQMLWSPWYYLFQLEATSLTGSHPHRGLKQMEVQCMHIYSGVLMWWSPQCRSPEVSCDPLGSAGMRWRSEVWQHIYSHSQSLPKALSLCHNHPAATKKTQQASKITALCLHFQLLLFVYGWELFQWPMLNTLLKRKVNIHKVIFMCFLKKNFFCFYLF